MVAHTRIVGVMLKFCRANTHLYSHLTDEFATLIILPSMFVFVLTEYTDEVMNRFSASMCCCLFPDGKTWWIVSNRLE